MAEPTRIDRRYATPTLRVDDPHIGLLDTTDRRLWVSRPADPSDAAPRHRLSHSLLFGTDEASGAAIKDRFVCFWFHTPRSGEGLLHGYPIEWDEGHLMIRLDPYWDYRAQKLLKSTDSHRVELNIEQQFKWGRHVFAAYRALRPSFPLSWHLIGPRPSDCMFYVARAEP